MMNERDVRHKDGRPMLLPRLIRPWHFIVAAVLVVLAVIEIQFAAKTFPPIHHFTMDSFLASSIEAANYFPDKITFIALILGVWFNARNSRHTIWCMLIALGLSSGFTGVVKEVTGRARPEFGIALENKKHRKNLKEVEEYIAEHPDTILRPVAGDYWLWFSKDRPYFKGDWASFPSGHATSAFCLAVWLGLLFPRGRFVWYALAVGTCLARIRMWRHHPADVMVGAACGYLTTYLIFSSYQAVQISVRFTEFLEGLTERRQAVSAAAEATQ